MTDHSETQKSFEDYVASIKTQKDPVDYLCLTSNRDPCHLDTILKDRGYGFRLKVAHIRQDNGQVLWNHIGNIRLISINFLTGFISAEVTTHWSGREKIGEKRNFMIIKFGPDLSPGKSLYALKVQVVGPERIPTDLEIHPGNWVTSYG